MPKVIKSTARETVIKVHSFCAQKCERNESVIPLKSVNARVAAITGVSERSVHKIVAEGKCSKDTSTKITPPGNKRNRIPCVIWTNLIEVWYKKDTDYTVKKDKPYKMFGGIKK